MSSHYSPPASSGITLPAGTDGVLNGLIGMDYNGTAYSPSGGIHFDTYWPNSDDSTSQEITDDPVETDDYIFTGNPIGVITVKKPGLYLIEGRIDLSGPVTVFSKNGLRIPNQDGISPRSFVPGMQNPRIDGVCVIRAGAVLSMQTFFDAADSGLLVEYVWFGIHRLAAASPLA